MAVNRLQEQRHAPAADEEGERSDIGRSKLFGAFLLIYVVWGSNFLAIRYAVETIPPFLLMGVRSFLAGACLFAWARFRGTERPTMPHWRAAASAGVLLFLGCHGLLAWAQQRVPSGIAALALATIPLWMTLLDWLWARGPRPAITVWIGIAIGLFGLGVLVAPGRDRGAIDSIALAALLASAFAWAAGSIVGRKSRLPSSVVLATGMQLLAGGLALLVVSVATGETARFDPTAVSFRSILGFVYMVVASSILAFTAYIWLLRISTPSRVGSYAFVNPLVAVFIGWTVGGEALTARTAVAALLIVMGVAAIVVRAHGRKE
jgi:drug/metabolite transporter (DMT)-like permease